MVTYPIHPEIMNDPRLEIADTTRLIRLVQALIRHSFDIIKVVDHKPGRIIPLDEASQQIKHYLGEQKKAQHAETYVDGLKKKSKIEVLI